MKSPEHGNDPPDQSAKSDVSAGLALARRLVARDIDQLCAGLGSDAARALAGRLLVDEETRPARDRLIVELRGRVIRVDVGRGLAAAVASFTAAAVMVVDPTLLAALVLLNIVHRVTGDDLFRSMSDASTEAHVIRRLWKANGRLDFSILVGECETIGRDGATAIRRLIDLGCVTIDGRMARLTEYVFIPPPPATASREER